jgi:hypothetical protein
MERINMALGANQIFSLHRLFYLVCIIFASILPLADIFYAYLLLSSGVPNAELGDRMVRLNILVYMPAFLLIVCSLILLIPIYVIAALKKRIQWSAILPLICFMVIWPIVIRGLVFPCLKALHGIIHPNSFENREGWG